jgi:hypothetical protein
LAPTEQKLDTGTANSRFGGTVLRSLQARFGTAMPDGSSFSGRQRSSCGLAPSNWTADGEILMETVEPIENWTHRRMALTLHVIAAEVQPTT